MANWPLVIDPFVCLRLAHFTVHTVTVYFDRYTRYQPMSNQGTTGRHAC